MDRKIVQVLLLFAFLTLSQSCINLNHIENKAKDANAFRIKRIEEHDMFYLIYAKRHDSTFKIIEDKNCWVDRTKHKKVHPGGRYNLELQNFFTWEIKKGYDDCFFCGLNHFGVSVTKNKKCHFKLYDAVNLKDLYIVSDTSLYNREQYEEE